MLTYVLKSPSVPPYRRFADVAATRLRHDMMPRRLLLPRQEEEEWKQPERIFFTRLLLVRRAISPRRHTPRPRPASMSTAAAAPAATPANTVGKHHIIFMFTFYSLSQRHEQPTIYRPHSSSADRILSRGARFHLRSTCRRVAEERQRRSRSRDFIWMLHAFSFRRFCSYAEKAFATASRATLRFSRLCRHRPAQARPLSPPLPPAFIVRGPPKRFIAAHAIHRRPAVCLTVSSRRAACRRRPAATPLCPFLHGPCR